MNKPERLLQPDLADWLPASLCELEHDQTAIPRIAKDAILVRDIEAALPGIPTTHDLWRRAAREPDFIPEPSVHLKGGYAEPGPELGIRNFAISLGTQALAFARLNVT